MPVFVDSEWDDEPVSFPTVQAAAAHYAGLCARETASLQREMADRRQTYSETYRGHACCAERPSTSTVNPLPVRFYRTADLRFPSPSDEDDEYWTPSDAPGVTELSYGTEWCSPSEAQTISDYHDLIDRARRLNEAVTKFWDDNQYYFVKVRWYQRRGLDPELPRLEIPSF